MFGRAVVLMKKCFGSFAAMAVSCACLMNCSLSSFAMDLNDCGTAFSGDAAENHKLANEWIDETKKWSERAAKYREEQGLVPDGEWTTTLDHTLGNWTKARDWIEFFCKLNNDYNLKTMEYEGGFAEITDQYLIDGIVEWAEANFTPEQLEEFHAADGKYRLFYIDGSVVAARDNIVSAVSNLSSSGAAGATISTGVYVMNLLDNVFIGINSERAALQEIDDFMVRYGYWGFTDDTVVCREEVEKGQMPFFNQMAGDDTYVISPNTGRIMIGDYCENNSGFDTLIFDYEVDISKLVFCRYEGSLYISDDANGNDICLYNYFSSDASYHLESIVVNDTAYSIDDILDIVDVFVGDENDNEITSYPEQSFICSAAGNDTILAKSGGNIIFAGEGDDVIESGSGNDIIYCEDGNDNAFAGGGCDFLFGGLGDDILCGADGNDLFYYRLGDGNDTINESKGYGVFPYGGIDILYLDEGIDPERTVVERSNSDLLLHINGNAATLTLPGIYQSGASPLQHPLDYVMFSDGTCWDFNTMLDLCRYVCGTDGDDVLRLTHEADGILKGFDGNDKMYGLGTNDTFYGGKGDDLLDGRSGDDTYYYFLGDGNDIIDEGNGPSSFPSGGNDYVYLGEGILPSETYIEITPDGYSFILHMIDGGTLTMTGNVVSGMAHLFPIEHIVFADGTEWTFSDLQANGGLCGTDGDDVIRDGSDNDNVFCGKGNDTIRGTGGGDTYIYQYGDGQDYIYDSGNFWGSGGDVLYLKGIAMEDVYCETKGSEYVFYIGSRSNSVRIYGIEAVRMDGCEDMPTAEFAAAAQSADLLPYDAAGDITGVHAILDGDIGVVFHVSVPDEYLDGSLVISMNGAENRTFTAEDFTQQDENGSYLLTYYVRSIQMAETITASFYDKDGVLHHTKSTSVEHYGRALLALPQSDKVIALVNAMLTYGNCAQAALSEINHWEIGSAYAAMKGSYKTPADQTAALEQYVVTKTGSDDTITRIQYTVSFDHAADINLYLTSEVQPIVLVDNEPAAVSESEDGVWKVTIPNHSASNLNKQHTVLINDSITLSDLTPLSYANRMLSDSSEKIQALANAFYAYYAAARA